MQLTLDIDAAMAVEMCVRDHSQPWFSYIYGVVESIAFYLLLLLPDGSKLSSRVLAQTAEVAYFMWDDLVIDL